MSDQKDFIIKDKRFSFQDDQEKDQPDDLKESPEKPDDRETAAETKDEKQELPLPEINFSTFVMSLNASALLHLGMIEDPATGKKTKNLSVGKQTIDILGMLEEKTKGNLSEDEEAMLKNILYDLRIIYVKEQG